MFKRNILAMAALCLVLVSARAMGEDRPLRVACIGDSITNAASSGAREKTSYPAQMQGMLGAGYDVKNFGVGGATMLRKSEKPYWTLKEYAEAKAFAPDIVVIKLGSNDSKPQHWDREAYERDYRDMVAEVAALPSRPRIILCRPVPAFSESFKIRNSVIFGDIIPIIDKISSEFRLPVVDAYNALREYGHTFPDGIHPNEEGCKVLAGVVAEMVRTVAFGIARD